MAGSGILSQSDKDVEKERAMQKETSELRTIGGKRWALKDGKKISLVDSGRLLGAYYKMRMERLLRTDSVRLC